MSYSLKGKNVLIIAGPTREYIDPVRYISNDSSGRMGFGFVLAARKLGAKVTLICGPVNKPPLKYLSVISAQEMFAAVKKHYKQADIVIMAAAVADFRPKKCSKNKIKKTYALKHLSTYALQLVPNPDILAWLGSHKRNGQMLIGFALETENLVKNARKKLKKKNCDLIVANDAEVIGKEAGSALIIDHAGIVKKIGRQSKQGIAKAVFSFIQNC